jgi:hypothetical protein
VVRAVATVTPLTVYPPETGGAGESGDSDAEQGVAGSRGVPTLARFSLVQWRGLGSERLV